MRCLVTGASGFVGSWLVRRLAGEGHEVLAMVRPGSDLGRLDELPAGVEFLRGSLGAIAELAAAIQSFGPDVTYHLAWTGGNSRRYIDDPAQVLTNVPGSLELVRIAAEAGCSTYIFAGSCVQYGQYRVPIREDDPLLADSLYGIAKTGVESLSEALCARLGMRFCGVRLFWAYGPGDDGLRMIPYVIGELLEGRRPALTAGRQLWDFLYVEDAVEALMVLARSGAAAGVFNLGSGKPVLLRDVVTLIRDLIDPRLNLGFGEIPYPPGQAMHLEADISKLKGATGWEPRTPLAVGLRFTVDALRKASQHVLVS